MKKVHATPSMAEAEILRVRLRAEGIESFLENEHGAKAVGEIPTMAVPFVISVADEDAEAAVRIVVEHFRERQGPTGLTEITRRTVCGCGKTLEFPADDAEPVDCPYCGRPVDPKDAPAITASPGPATSDRLPRPIAPILVFLALVLAGILLYKLATAS